jgi:NSS family neurotransmitter:Na+ symporter
MFELSTRVLLDTGLKRSQSIGIVVVAVYLLGIPSARNLELLSNQDFVWGIGLMISGAFIAFAIMRNKVPLMVNEINAIPRDWKVGTTWSLIIRWFIPVAALALLVWWMFLSATVFAPEAWYNPFNPFSIMTCLAQFLLVLMLFMIFNRRISSAMQV